MTKKSLVLVLCLIIYPLVNTLGNALPNDSVPEIYYSSPQKYTIAGISVSGIKHYEENLLINISGLTIGQEISVPGDAITNSIKKFWRHGLFSDVSILATKIVDDKIWLNISLTERPRLSLIN